MQLANAPGWEISIAFIRNKRCQKEILSAKRFRQQERVFTMIKREGAKTEIDESRAEATIFMKK